MTVNSKEESKYLSLYTG